MKYHKIIFTCLLFFLFSCSEKSNLPTESSIKYGSLEYEITAGEAGIFHNTSIDENGNVYFTHYYSGKGEYEISTSLSSQKHDSLIKTLLDNDFWDLSDKYSPPGPVVDGISFTLSYTTEDTSKTIVVEAGVEFPMPINNIFKKLYDTDEYILANPDHATLVMPWNLEYTIKEWPFSDCVSLSRQSFNYADIDCSTEILAYFEDIRNNTDYNILYWDSESLFEIYDGGEDKGYFNAYEQYPIKYYQQQFSYNLSDVKNDGILLDSEQIDNLKYLLSFSEVYVIDELKDNGSAVFLTLVPGKLCE